MTNKRQKKPLELYVHIPFCARKCLYCDFLSFRTLASVHEDYVEQLLREIQAMGACCNEYQVVTIFIGGGTPSVLEPEMIRNILKEIRNSFDVSPDSEITIEVNPGTLLQNKLYIYREAGINRLSMGLQSADNDELRNLGRIHSFEEFLKSFQAARMAGFNNINVDLMSAVPGQTEESWRNTLKKVTMLKPEHISAYSLIIEEGTPFWKLYGQGAGAGVSDPDRFDVAKKDYPPLPDEDTENQIYHLTRAFLAEQGYERYEISNYARPGCACAHNIGYWTGVAYLGLGLGASSYMADWRFRSQWDLDAYLHLDFQRESWLSELHPQSQQLTREARMEEFMFLGLRMLQGVSEIDFVSAFGVKLETVYGPVIERMIQNGLMRRNGVWLSLTEWGMDVSNHVLSEFLLD